MPMPERYLSAALINYKGRKILVDCGEGTQVSMRLLGWGFKTIDVICITHEHGDHIVGLPGLLATIGNSGRTEPLTIIGPEGIIDIVWGLRVIAPFLPYEIHIIENPQEPINIAVDRSGIQLIKEVGEMEIRCLKADHSAPCLSYCFYIKRSPKFDVERALANQVPKILWNKLQKIGSVEYEGVLYTPDMVMGAERKGIKISYVTDSRPIEEIVDFIWGSDLFVCEGTYGSDEDKEKAVRNKHMTFREAAGLAKAGRVEELLLTHFSPTMQEPEQYRSIAEEEFRPVIIGRDRLIKNLIFRDK